MERQIIRQFYQTVLKEAAETDKISRETRTELEALLKETDGETDPGKADQHRDELFLAASAAEENGFVKGFQYAFRLFMECAGE